MEFSAIFWKIFPKIFAIFFDFCDFPAIFPENFCLQSVTVQPGSRHYCKFTIKFTPKFTPILIKILQSTKFEDSHFHNLSQLLTHFHNLSQLLTHFHNSLRTFSTPFNSLPSFEATENFSLRCRVFSTIAPPCQRYQWPSFPLRRRRYVGNTRDYK